MRRAARCGAGADPRRRELARIHLLAHDLGLDEATYRDLLWTIARVRSAATLDAGGRAAVIAHLARLADPSAACLRADTHRQAHEFLSPRIRLPEERAAMGCKLCALLATRGAGHRYADAIAQRMFGLSRWEFAGVNELHKLIACLCVSARRQAALECDRRRRGSH